uniref:Uncharacterized protein n=1 Tax=Oryza meridionalis TaxID=40149 RepID=A0A0E0EVM7_9ORYZ
MVGVLLLLSIMPLAAGELLAQLCGNGGNYTANGTYQSNLARLAAALPSNASSSPDHFATATAGQAPDAAYALALCRGDVANATACGDCVAASFQDARRTCPSDKSATIYYDDCLLRFAGDDFLAAPNITENATLFQAWNQQNITGDAAVAAANVRELLTVTARTAAAAARRFATGFMDGSSESKQTLYSLVQCTPDLAAGDCLACLQRLIAMVNSTTSVRLGGRVLLLRCNLRFEAFVFYAGEPTRRVSPPGSTPAPDSIAPTKNRKKSKSWVIAAIAAPVAAVVLCLIVCYYCRWSRRFRKDRVRLREKRSRRFRGDELICEMEGEISEFSVFEFREVIKATDNFSEENKLGEGGFGPVYKGLFSEGLEIAVKRLASHSGQGFLEFKNEVQLIAKLQHRNLVRLLGCCSQGEEKILVYEYLPNKSLDFYIFDERKKDLLDWNKRLVIIEGIAQGLLYLHKHSRLRVIHRDLKPSNILLDSEMNPKISDFGLAKIFGSNSNEGTTRRVVGTYGYMAPEYSSEGLFSPKSDVFSFGVIILEIISGKRNASLDQCEDFINLLGYAWKLWSEERWLEFLDASLVTNWQSSCMLRCINIALLCVQENAVDRPTMSNVVAMLSSESMVLDEPKHPAYFHVRVTKNDESSTVGTCSTINDVTINY